MSRFDFLNDAELCKRLKESCALVMNDLNFHVEFIDRALRAYQTSVKLVVSRARPRPDAEDTSVVLQKVVQFEFAPLLNRLNAEQLGVFISTLAFYSEARFQKKEPDEELLQLLVKHVMSGYGIDEPPSDDDIARAHYRINAVIAMISLYDPKQGLNALASLYRPAYRQLAELHARKFDLQERYFMLESNYESLVSSFSAITKKIEALNGELQCLDARLQKKLGTDKKLDKVFGWATKTGHLNRYPTWQQSILADVEKVMLEISKKVKVKRRLYQSKLDGKDELDELATEICRVEDEITASVFLTKVYARVKQRFDVVEEAVDEAKAFEAETREEEVHWLAGFVADSVLKDTAKTVKRITAERREAEEKAARLREIDEVRSLAHGVAESAVSSMLIYHACVTSIPAVATDTSLPASASASPDDEGLGVINSIFPLRAFGIFPAPAPKGPSPLRLDQEEQFSDSDTDGADSPPWWKKISSRFH
ncbi:MAG: hypothetical protein P1U63_03415 [Coxiellaceae bacterium]|nr:hypothetical protein [Coxiellaceae bacterium]